MSDFDVRLRLMQPDGTPGRVLKTSKIELAVAGSSVATVQFVLSDAYESLLQAPFVVGLEYCTVAEWRQPRNDLFIVPEDQSDNVDPSLTLNYSAVAYIPWLLERNQLGWQAWAKDGQRSWEDASAGWLMSTLVNEAKGRGWGPFVSTDFSSSTDSSGAAWTADDKTDHEYPLDQTALSILTSLTDQGLCEWWTEGTLLRLVRAGTGADQTRFKLGGAGYSRAPFSSSFNDVFTHLVVTAEKSGKRVVLPNPGAPSQFGRLESSLSLPGIGWESTATRLAQPVLEDGRAVKREMSFEWVRADGRPRPFADFQVGDNVTVRTRTGLETRRVVACAVTKDQTKVTLRVVAGERIASRDKKVAKRVASTQVGKHTGGSGVSVAPATRPGIDPAAPSGVTITSNVGYFTDDGKARARVGLTWNAVVEAADGSALDVASYEVHWKATTAAGWRVAKTVGPELNIDTWESGVTLDVKVRARSYTGVYGEFSAQVAVTPAFPVLVLPAPSTPSLTSELGTVTVSWDGMLGGVTPPAGFKHVLPQVQDGGSWVVVGQPMNGPGQKSVVTGLAVGANPVFRLVPYSILGNPGTVSPTSTITVKGVALPDVEGDIADAIDEALGTSSAAQTAAVAAMQEALDAQEAADAANTEALAAAGLANGKGKVIYQVSAPTGANANVNNLWIRTTDNKPHTYNGSSWVAVESKVATDAADAAATADAKAVAAQNTANSAAAAAAAAQDTATSALTSASGRNAIYHSTAAASGSGTRVGDMWHQWSSQGVNGRLLAVWVWTGSAWQQRQLDETYIPLLNIGAGTYGSLDGVRISAKTITADKVIVAELGNLIPNGSFIEGLSGWTGSAPATVETVTDGPDGSTVPVLRITPSSADQSRYPVAFPPNTSGTAYEPGTSYAFTMRVRRVSGTAGSIRIRLGFHGVGQGNQWPVVSSTDLPASGATAGTWYTVTGTHTTPIGNPRNTMSVSIHVSGAAGTVFEVADIAMRQMASAELIVDGEVTARHLKATEIWANTAWIDLATVNVLKAGSIESHMLAVGVGGTGQRLELVPSGLALYDSEGTKRLSLSTSGDDFLDIAAKNAQGDEVSVAQIDSAGNALFQNVDISTDATFQGAALVGEFATDTVNGMDLGDIPMLERMARPIVASAAVGTANYASVGHTYAGLAIGSVHLLSTRIYQVRVVGPTAQAWVSGSGAGNLYIQAYVGTGTQNVSTPNNVNGDNSSCVVLRSNGSTDVYVQEQFNFRPFVPGTTGDFNILIRLWNESNRTWSFNPGLVASNPVRVEIVDLGPAAWTWDAGNWQNRSTTGNVTPPTPSSRTQTWNATWSVLWGPSGSIRPSGGSLYDDGRMLQGGHTLLGTGRAGRVGFPALGISGRTIKGAWLRLKVRHTSVSTATLRLGTHGDTSATTGSSPNLANQFTRSVKKGQDLWIPIPSARWAAIASGTIRGFQIGGPNVNSGSSDYVILDGFSTTNAATSSGVRPQLKITYQ